MNVAAAAIVGAVAGWIGGVVLIVIIRWLSAALFDADVVLRGLEFAGMIAGIALAVLLGRRSNADKGSGR